MSHRHLPRTLRAWPVGIALALTACATVGPAPSDATLGIRTSVPDDREAADLGLAHHVRWRGQVLRSIEPNGPLANAGVQAGDALIQLDDNEIYSQDDLADFLRVSRPGQEVTALVHRRGATEPERLSLRLGATQAAAGAAGIDWQFAGLGQLPRALEQARVEAKKVLVGLSGAET